MFEIRFKIGKVIIALMDADDQRNFPVEEVYQRFITTEQPQVVLHHRLQLPPSHADWEVVFKTQGVWQLFRQTTDAGACYAVDLHSPVFGPDPYQVGIFSSDFLSGELYTAAQYFTQRPIPFPLRYPMAEVIMINLLSQGRGILLHACAVQDGEHGYLFSGISGAGKSTTASLWEHQPGVKLLSDDRVILHKEGDAFWIYGTPWHGDARAASPQAIRLDKIFVLRHGNQNQLVPLQPLDLVSRLMVRSFPTFWDAAGMEYSLGLLSELSQAVAGYEFSFLPDQSAVEFIRCSCAH